MALDWWVGVWEEGRVWVGRCLGGMWVGGCLGRGEGVGVCFGGKGCGWEVGGWRLSCCVKETSQRKESTLQGMKESTLHRVTSMSSLSDLIQLHVGLQCL